MRASALVAPDWARANESGLDELQSQAVRLMIYATAAVALVFNLGVAFTPLVLCLGWLLVGAMMLVALAPVCLLSVAVLCYLVSGLAMGAIKE